MFFVKTLSEEARTSLYKERTVKKPMRAACADIVATSRRYQKFFAAAREELLFFKKVVLACSTHKP
jgi:hypothetical protein